MNQFDRKARIRKYKETSLPAGICSGKRGSPMKYVLLIVVVSFVAAIAAADFTPTWDDSTYLALRYQGELEVPQSTVDLIISPRALIESAFPVVANFSVYREWQIGSVRCSLSEDAWDEFQAGGLQELRDVAAANLCVIWTDYISLKMIEFQSILPLHSERLAELFSVVDGVLSCEAFLFCCDGSTIEVLDLGPTSRYLNRLAWGDCPMGCIYEHCWEFLVSGTDVTMLDEWGVVENETQTWGSVKAMYR